MDTITCGGCGYVGGDHDDDCVHRHQPAPGARWGVRREPSPRPRYGAELAERARQLQTQKATGRCA